jgi:hypothetical protein
VINESYSMRKIRIYTPLEDFSDPGTLDTVVLKIRREADNV